VLTTRAAKRNHQVLETSALIVPNAGVNQGCGVRQEMMYGIFFIQVLDDRGVLSGETLESFFAAGILQAAAIKYESSSIPRFIFRQSASKRKTKDSDNQVFAGYG
jgi:hypothetical protein